MMPYIPSRLIEAANGVICIFILWMLLFAALHLCRMYREHLKVRQGPYGRWRALCALYSENKPEIALITFLAGLFSRQGMFWYFRVLQDHGWHADNVITRHGPQLTIVTTGVMIVGASCWVRVISPLEPGKDFIVWLAMVAAAIVVGVGFALL
jgi:hypothetical protein